MYGVALLPSHFISEFRLSIINSWYLDGSFVQAGARTKQGAKGDKLKMKSNIPKLPPHLAAKVI